MRFTLENMFAIYVKGLNILLICFGNINVNNLNQYAILPNYNECAANSFQYLSFETKILYGLPMLI